MPSTGLRPVLILAFHFPPDNAPGALRPGRWFKYLPEFGFQPTVITASESGPGIHAIPAPMMEVPDKKTLEGWGELVLRKWVFPTEQAIFWSVQAARRAAELHRQTPMAAVISTSPPLNTQFAALSLKRRYGIPWIADFRDAVAGSPFRDYGLVSRAADRWAEKRFFKHADAIIGVADRMQEDWTKRWPQWGSKMHTIWNGFDPQENFPQPGPRRRSSRILLHIGTLYGVRHPMTILNSFARLLAAGRIGAGQFTVRLVGDIADQIRTQNAEVFERLTRIGLLELHPSVPRAQALQEMADADALILLDIMGQDSSAVPAKLYEYIRIGSPILAITTPNSPVERILAGSGIPRGVIYPRDIESEVDDKIASFLAQPSGHFRPSEWFAENFDGRRQAGVLSSLLEKIIAKQVEI